MYLNAYENREREREERKSEMENGKKGKDKTMIRNVISNKVVDLLRESTQ